MIKVIDSIAEKAVNDFSKKHITHNALMRKYKISRPTAAKVIVRLIMDRAVEMVIFPLSKEKRYRLI